MHASLKNQFIVCGDVVNNSITSDNCMRSLPLAKQHNQKVLIVPYVVINNIIFMT